MRKRRLIRLSRDQLQHLMNLGREVFVKEVLKEVFGVRRVLRCMTLRLYEILLHTEDIVKEMDGKDYGASENHKLSWQCAQITSETILKCSFGK